MLKEAIQYLVSLKDNKTYQINGEPYTDRELVRVAPHVDRPGEVRVNGLDSIVKLVSHELDMLENLPVYIRVVSPRQVEVFSTLDSVMGRDDLYVAVCDAPDFAAGKWMPHENAIIALRSAFVPNEGTEYLLDLLSRISKEDGVTTEDNGVSQTVSARQGIALKRFEQVRQRIALRPYRTFTEVEQPESEFILRLNEDAEIALIEADGGRWKMDAKAAVAAYFEEKLAGEIQDGRVVVMM